MAPLAKNYRRESASRSMRPCGRTIPRRANCLVAGLSPQTRHRIFAIQFRDVARADLRGTNGFALVGVRAIAETLGVHRRHHFQDAARALGLALRQKREMLKF